MQKHEKAPLASGMKKPCEKNRILMQMANNNRISLSNSMLVTPLHNLLLRET